MAGYGNGHQLEKHREDDFESLPLANLSEMQPQAKEHQNDPERQRLGHRVRPAQHIRQPQNADRRRHGKERAAEQAARSQNFEQSFHVGSGFVAGRLVRITRLAGLYRFLAVEVKDERDGGEKT